MDRNPYRLLYMLHSKVIQFLLQFYLFRPWFELLRMENSSLAGLAEMGAKAAEQCGHLFYIIRCHCLVPFIATPYSALPRPALPKQCKCPIMSLRWK